MGEIEVEMLLSELNENEENSLSSTQTNIVSYISGSTIRSLMKRELKCSDCINLVLGSCDTDSSVASHRLIDLKDYKKGALIRVSSAVEDLILKFEEHIQSQESIIIRSNPQQRLVSQFFKCFPSYIDQMYETLNCPHNHSNALLINVLKKYAICRIFYYVKLFNREIKGKKKSSDLNKLRKLV